MSCTENSTIVIDTGSNFTNGRIRKGTAGNQYIENNHFEFDKSSGLD